jgi:hypothetical protein
MAFEVSSSREGGRDDEHALAGTFRPSSMRSRVSLRDETIPQ